MTVAESIKVEATLVISPQRTAWKCKSIKSAFSKKKNKNCAIKFSLHPEGFLPSNKSAPNLIPLCLKNTRTMAQLKVTDASASKSVALN